MCSTTLYPFDRPKDQRKGQIGTCEETGEEIFGGFVAILGQGVKCDHLFFKPSGSDFHEET